ncbi:MAG: LacI family DNA-binding transcriptional regulator [Lachnospiraceae bacterium]
MNIYDIAKMTGVSIATVSRVVNGNDKVSEKTKQKVLAAIEDVGYVPNAFAKGLGSDTMHAIGILVPEVSDIFMAMAVSYLEEYLHKYGYGCILGCSGYSQSEKEAHVQILLSRRIDALIAVGSTYSGKTSQSSETEYLRRAAVQTPLFMINGSVEGDQIYCSVNDDKKAVLDVTSACIQKGRRNILFLTDSESFSARNKLSGYKEALENAGISYRKEMILKVKNDIHAVRDLLLASSLGFDCVIATNDALAIGAIKYAAARGIKIPQDMDIIGYNNSPLSTCCEPELTSVDNHVRQVCFDTVERVIKILNKETTVEKNIVLACDLIKRATTDF